MSKNLRVFLLSLLVIVLGVSSAFAAARTNYTLKTDATSPVDWKTATNWTGGSDGTYPGGTSGDYTVALNPDKPVTINLNGSLIGNCVSIDVSGNKAVTLELSTSTVITGSTDITVHKGATLIVNGGNTSAAFFVSGSDRKWTISGDLDFNSAIFLNDDAALSVDVASKATALFKSDAKFNKGIKFAVSNDAELTFSNKDQLKDAKINLSGTDAKLTLNFSASVISRDNALQICMLGYGANIEVPDGKTVALTAGYFSNTSGPNFLSSEPSIFSGDKPLVKTGKGTLVINGASPRNLSNITNNWRYVNYTKPVINETVHGITVEAGKLELNRTYTSVLDANNTNAKYYAPVVKKETADASLDIQVYTDAELVVNSHAIEFNGAKQLAVDADSSTSYGKVTLGPAAFTTVSETKTNRVSLDLDGTLVLEGNNTFTSIEGANTGVIDGGGEYSITLNGAAENYNTYKGSVSAAELVVANNLTSYPFAKAKEEDIPKITVSAKTTLTIDSFDKFEVDELVLAGGEKSTGRNLSDLAKIEPGRLVVKSTDVTIKKMTVSSTFNPTSDANTAPIIIGHESNDSKLTVEELVLNANYSYYTTFTGVKALYINRTDSNDKGKAIVTLKSISSATSTSDVADENAAVKVDGKSPVTLKLEGTLPSGHGLTVGDNATLEVANGLTLPTNLVFEGTLPRFKTTLTADNAAASTKYAVTVGGNITIENALGLDMDYTSLKDTELAYSNVIKGRPYKVLGASGGTSSTYTAANIAKTWLISNDASFDVNNNFKIIKSLTNGVGVEIKNEIQYPTLGEPVFVEGEAAFGTGAAFKVEIPVIYSNDKSKTYAPYLTVSNPPKVEDDKAILMSTIDTSNASNVKVIITGYPTTKPLEVTVSLDWDFTKASSSTRTNHSSPLNTAMFADFGIYADDSTDVIAQFFATSEHTFTLGKAADDEDEESDDIWATDDTEASTEKPVIVEGDPFVFTIKGMRVITTTATSIPVLVNGTYVWNTTAPADNYEILVDGTWTTVTDIKVLVDGKEIDVSDVEIVADGTDSVKVTVPSTLLGASTTEKEVEVTGVNENGQTVHADKVTVTVLSSSTKKEAITDLKPVVLGTGSQQVVVVENITLSGDGEIEFVSNTETPSWIVFDGGSNVISYTINTDGTEAAAGTYDFEVVAKNSDDAIIYTFTIEVVAEEEKPTISVSDGASGSFETGEEYTATFTATAPVSWDVTDLPGSLDVTTNEATQYVISGTLNEAGEFTYKVTASVNGEAVDSKDVTITVAAPVFKIALTDETEDFTEGYNYRAVYTASNAAGVVTWTLTTDADWLSGVVSGDYAEQYIITGLLPAYDSVNDENDYDFTVSAVDENGASDEDENTITVEEDEYITASLENLNITTDADFDNITEGFETTLNNIPDELIALNEDGTIDGIDIPDWLTYEVTPNAAGDYASSITFKLNPTAGLANGTVGAVHIPLEANDGDYDVLSFSVTYTGEDVPVVLPLTITAGKTSIELRPGSSDVITLSADDSNVEYTAVATPTGLTLTPGTNSVTIAAPANAASGDYVVTITGTVGTRTGSVDVAVKVLPANEEPGPGPEPQSEDFTVTVSGEASVTVEAGATATVTLVPANAAPGAIVYTPSQTWVSVVNNVVTITAPETADTYTVTINATDAAGRAATTPVTLTVTVTARVTPVESEDKPVNVTGLGITMSGDTAIVDIEAGATTTATLSMAGAVGTVDYVSNRSWVVISGDQAIITAPTTAGTHTATITGVDSANNTQTVTVSVTVDNTTPPTPREFSLRLNVGSEYEISADRNYTVNLIPSNANGAITYSADVDPANSGLTVTLNNNSTATVRANSSAAGRTFTVKVTATDAAGNVATATVTVTVSPLTGGPGSSSGGCDAGFGALALALAAPLFLRRRRS